MLAELHSPSSGQDNRVLEIANDMAAERVRFCEKTNTPLEQLGDTTVLVAAPPNPGTVPRFWKIMLFRDRETVEEILQNPGVWIEGSAQDVFNLLYGFSLPQQKETLTRLGIEESIIKEELNISLTTAARNRINFWAMPIQDAMDFAAFCANTQIQMDRFLPGLGNCGGPVDVMTLEMAPSRRIRSFPGKSLHHPDEPRHG